MLQPAHQTHRHLCFIDMWNKNGLAYWSVCQIMCITYWLILFWDTEKHNFDFKENTRTNSVSVRFLSPLQSSQGTFFLSDLHTAAPHIFTRPWPNWFLFSFNIPLELAFLSAPWNKTLKGGRGEKNSSPHSAGKHKSLQRRPEKKLLFEATERSK